MNTSFALAVLVSLNLLNVSPQPLPLINLLTDGFREEIYKGQSHLGLVTVTSQVLEKNGKKTGVRLQKDTNLTMQRFGSLVQLRMVETQEMDAIGTVNSISMKQFQGPMQIMALNGLRDGASFRIWVENNKERVIPWDIYAFGPLGKEQLVAGKKWTHNEQIQFDCYQAVVNRIVTFDVVATQKVPEGAKDPVAWTILMIPHKIIAGNQTLQLPKTLYFLDQNQKVLFSETEMDGIGDISLVRFKAGPSPIKSSNSVFDIGKASFIPLSRRISAAKSAMRVSYLITIPGLQGELPVVEDERQKITQKKGNAYLLEVKASRTPEETLGSEAPTPQEMAPSKFIDWNHPAIKNYLRDINLQEADLWRRAVMIEKLIRRKIYFDNQAPFASASEVAKNSRGDCRHAALLLAALCRSEGIPSRIAHGLVYVEKNGQPMFGFHMWTEVFVRGRWMPLDGTMGLGFVGADHIKVSHHTYAEVESLAPIASLQNFIGKVKIEVD